MAVQKQSVTKRYENLFWRWIQVSTPSGKPYTAKASGRVMIERPSIGGYLSRNLNTVTAESQLPWRNGTFESMSIMRHHDIRIDHHKRVLILVIKASKNVEERLKSYCEFQQKGQYRHTFSRKHFLLVIFQVGRHCSSLEKAQNRTT